MIEGFANYNSIINFNMSNEIFQDTKASNDSCFNCSIKYNFYLDYLDNSKFSEIFEMRKKYIREKYLFKGNEEDLIEEYFVEIFSWTVIPKSILFDINKIIKNIENSEQQDDSNNKFSLEYTVFDPCCGNSFHAFLFDKFCNRKVIPVDIQPEKNAWINTISYDGLNYLKKIENHRNIILFLSWVDYDELTYQLTKNFKGNIIISVGNYENISLKYLKELHSKFKRIKFYEFNMPWYHKERLKIYIRK